MPTFITWNINYSRRAVAPLWEKCSLSKRLPTIYSLILKGNYDICFLQEIFVGKTAQEEQENKSKLEQALNKYNWYFAKTNSRDGVCCHAIGVSKTFMPKEPRLQWNHDFAELEKTAENALIVKVGEKLHLVCLHCPMQQQGRMVMANNIQRCFPNGLKQDDMLIMAGDFNSFADDGSGYEQLAITLNKLPEGATIASNGALSQRTGKVATRSFVSYPYDPVPESAIKKLEELELQGKDCKLDHVFAYGCKPVGTMVVMDDEKILQEDGSFIPPSDHFAIVGELVC